MAVFVYRRAASTGARDLARELVGGQRTRVVPRLGPNDHLICWGSDAGLAKNRRILNDVPLQNKYQDALKLKEKGVSTIEVVLRRPVVEVARPAAEPIREANFEVRHLFDQVMNHAVDFVEEDNPNFGSRVFIAGVNQFRDSLVNLARGLAQLGAVNLIPAPVARPAANVEWLGRTYDHVGGKDLLRPNLNKADFYSKKEEFVEEFRIHSFLGKSIRAGRKVHREDARNIHPWIRSWDGGWKMLYEGVKGTPELRELAHKAVAALGLDFGAVDIGKRRDGSLVVLEVNRAPGIEGGTVTRYKDAIEAWMRGR